MAKENTVKSTVAESTTDKFENIVSKSSDLFQDPKNRTFLSIGLGVLVLLVGAGTGFLYWKSNQNKEAQSLLSPSVFYFEADSLKKALNGDGVNDGTQTISDSYGMTDAGNLADFYTGVSYLKEGKFDDAIEYLKKFSSSDLLVQARAYSLIGDAYLEKNEIADAIDYYKKAAAYKPNKYFTPQYLMKLALAQEKQKEYDNAIATYSEVIEKYFDSAESMNAKKYKSKLEGLAGK